MTLRTPQSQGEDLSSYQNDTRVKKQAANAVTSEFLLPVVDFWHVIPPPLHLSLGLVNDSVKLLRSWCSFLDGEDDAKRLAREELSEKIEEKN